MDNDKDYAESIFIGTAADQIGDADEFLKELIGAATGDLAAVPITELSDEEFDQIAVALGGLIKYGG
jgi:hypothetical protein